MGLCPRPNVPGHQEMWTFPPTRFGPFLSTRRQDKPKAKRNQDPSPEPHCRAGPPYTLEPQRRPHPKPRGKPWLFLQFVCPTGLCWWRKTYPAEDVTHRFCPEVIPEQAAQVPLRQSNRRQGPRAPSRGRSRATAAADLEPGARGHSGLPGFQPA